MMKSLNAGTKTGNGAVKKRGGRSRPGTHLNAGGDKSYSNNKAV